MLRKPLRLMAALMAFCVLAATFPPVGLAAEEKSGYFDLKAAVENAQPESTITLPGDAEIAAEAGAPPWIIGKNVTIDGKGNTVFVRALGILLDADVTFQNIKISLEVTEGRNAIIANGHHLTLDNVTATNLSVNIFCGALEKASGDNFSVPGPGDAGAVTIKGNTALQGTSNIMGPANIYAGSLSIGSFLGDPGEEGDGVPTTFSGNVSIDIRGSAGTGSLGTIYAGGGQNRKPQGASTGKVITPNPDKYRVDGTVTITGTNALPNVNGEGATATEVVYTGNGNEDIKTLEAISSLSVESGKLVLTGDSYLQNDGTLTLESGAKLDLRNVNTVPSLDGNEGFLFLRGNQTLFISGPVTGTTKVAIGGTASGDDASLSSATPGHVYISAPYSTDGNFQLLPYSMQPNMTLVWDANGIWTATDGSSGETINRVTSFQIAPDECSISMAEDADIQMEVEFESEVPAALDFIPLTVSVDGKDLVANEDPVNEGYYTYTYQGGMLEMTVMDDALCITPDRQYSADTYKIQVTIPAKYNGAGKTLTDSVTLIVTDGGGTPDPGPKSIPVPTANTGLRWTGSEQTGVNEGEGYTLSGTSKATAVGNYTATATLKTDYQWADGSQDAKNIPWSIAKALGPAAPAGLAGVAPSAAGAADGEITGTTSAMEYAASASFTGAQTCGDPKTTGLAAGTYYVRLKETPTHEAGAHTPITVPAPGAAVVTGILVNSTTHKTEYRVGDDLDVKDLTIEVSYSDGTPQTVPVTAGMVTGFDSTQAVESQTLTILYEGKTATYTVKIVAAEQPGGTKYRVEVNNAGTGGSGGGSYAEGETVTVRAGSKSGFLFSSWQPTGVTLSNRFSPEIQFIMPANDVVLLVTWKLDDGSTPPVPSHTHAWGTGWKSSATHHWHDCSASGCPIADNSQKSGYAAHTAGDWVVDRPATSSQSGTRHKSCTVCGYELARETLPATGGGSSSGGSSSSGSSNTTTTEKNPDGSTTSTNTNKTTGTVTETTRRPDGSKLVVETKKDGTVTTTDTAKDGSTVKTVSRPDGTSETTVKRADGLTASVRESGGGARADVRLPAKVVQESQDGGVALPIPALLGENTSITIHTGSVRLVPVEIPVRGNAATTVAYLVNGDGSEAMIKTAFLSGGEMTVRVPNGATVRLRDNGKSFRDTRGHWAEDAIAFSAARELFSGKTATSFAPDAPMSRAMLMTVLSRLDGVDAAGGSAYETGMAWAVAQGISDGRNPEGQVTREQFVAMLHRYAGSPAATDRELRFSDTEAVSAYAREAARWAVENGILSGYGDGSFAPKGKATRAQAATMLTRYIQYLNGQS